MVSLHKQRFTRLILSVLRLLRISALTRGAYQLLPLMLRARLSRWHNRMHAEQFKFARTSGWRKNVPSLRHEQADPKTDLDDREMPGVNLFAYVYGQFGLAESARLYARALHSAGVPLSVRNVDIALPHAMGDRSVDDLICDDSPFATNLLFFNPDMLPEVMAGMSPGDLEGRHSMACWYWELERFPDPWKPSLEKVDSFLASSNFIRELLMRVTDKPVFHVPLPILEGDDAGLQRSDFGLPDRAFVFMTSFDFNSSLARKNPDAVIRAFQEAFHERPGDVVLLIKTSNGQRYPNQFCRLLDMVRGDERILIRDDIIERSQMRALQRCVDAYVSLHRAEGFGLGLAECMALGKPVIATGWSGNTDFMTTETSMLVDYELVSVGEGEYPHHVDQRWAEPDVSQAARFMRRLVQDPEYARSLGRYASAHVRENLSGARVASKLVDILAGLRDETSRRHFPKRPPGVGSIVE